MAATRTSASAWLLLLSAIVCEVVATLCLKVALTHPALYVVVVVGYVAAFALLSLVLRTGMPLGAAYGIWSACGVALTALLATLVLDESLTPLMGVGIVVIVAGVLMVELGSEPDSRTAAARAP